MSRIRPGHSMITECTGALMQHHRRETTDTTSIRISGYAEILSTQLMKRRRTKQHRNQHKDHILLKHTCANKSATTNPYQNLVRFNTIKQDVGDF